MVTTDPHEYQKPKEEVDVRVVTRGGIWMRMDLERGEIVGQKIEGKIRKETQAAPNFNSMQQKQFLGDAQRALKEDRARKELQHMTQRSLEESCVHEEVQCSTQISLEEACVHE
jgi:hypothetical protein